MTDLLGRWKLIAADEALGLDPGVITHFRPGGELLYIVPEEDRTSVMRLTFRVDGHFLITNQPYAPREVRTEFELHGDRLLLKYEGGVAHFGRIASASGARAS